MHPDLSSRKIYVNLSAGQLRQVDDLAQREFMSRSTLIRIAIMEYLRKPENAAKLNLPQGKPGEDVEWQQFLAEYRKAHPEVDV